jgi:hypothetical protein
MTSALGNMLHRMLNSMFQKIMQLSPSCLGSLYAELQWAESEVKLLLDKTQEWGDMK